MNLLSICIALLFCVTCCGGEGVLRATHKDDINTQHDKEHRKLTYYVGGTMYSGHEWYNNYKSSQLPSNLNQKGDKEDFYRNADKCLSKDGRISSSSCPSVPDCSFTGKFGPAKLCINRLPTPKGDWYVGALGCIPRWENCDKCMCGTQQGSGKTARCKFNRNQEPDDDAVKVDCNNLSEWTMDGHKVKLR